MSGCSQVENRTEVGVDESVTKSITISENMAGGMGGEEISVESLKEKLKLPGGGWTVEDLSEGDEVKIRATKLFANWKSAQTDFEFVVSEEQSILGNSEFIELEEGGEFVERYRLKVPMSGEDRANELAEGVARLRAAWTIGELSDREAELLADGVNEILISTVFGPSEPLLPILMSSPNRFERDVRLRCFEPMTQLFLSVDGVSEDEARGMVMSLFKELNAGEEFSDATPQVGVEEGEEEESEASYSLQVVFSAPQLRDGNGRFDPFKNEYFWDFYSMRLEHGPVEMRAKFNP